MIAEAQDLFPGGVNSPIRAYRAVGGNPPTLVRGEGAHVWDADGRRYVDWVSAYGPLIAGHAHPSVLAAVQQALAAGGPFGVTTQAEVRLAEMVRERMPSIERIRFCTSGTEAAMSAVRVARAATGRPLLVRFANAYHGHSEAVMGGPGLLTPPYNDLEALEALPLDQVAAVIVEPVAGNAGVVPPAGGFLSGLRRLCDRHGTLLIFDEVITGFRVAPGGAQQLYGVRPDLTVLGKIIGGGLPVGAYGGRADLMDLVAPAGPVYQAGTLAGHPAVMAAGAATLELLDDAAYRRLEQVGDALEEGLRAAGRVARVGSMLTVFLPDDAAFAHFHRRLREGGALIPPSQQEAWFVSL
ncbi:MAG: aminotransferase class III-fold pyridoxal phosphate-dependent enzyme, partial [Candidatus Dormibacteraeota bacterium]|nr:aminotransferase class III-fold pyridoxal phosphate-dependent enzyme [Candidatus Dormibacteraeota bacterium]